MKIVYNVNLYLTIFFGSILLISSLSLEFYSFLIVVAITGLFVGGWQLFSAFMIILGGLFERSAKHAVFLVLYSLLVILFFTMSKHFSNEINAMSKYKMYTFEIGIPFIIYLLHFYYSFKFRNA